MLTKEQKRLVKLENNVKKWSFALLKKFKKSLSIAMTTMIEERYTMKDAHRKRELFKFAQIIIRVAKFANMIIFS